MLEPITIRWSAAIDRVSNLAKLARLKPAFSRAKTARNGFISRPYHDILLPLFKNQKRRGL